MKTEVSISERLKDLRVEKKLNLEELAELTGISKSALGSYELDTPREMNHKNLIALAGFYEVSVDYLLGQTENRSLPNAPLSELRLSDAMVELLKSGRINNRLLCELVTHEKFAELMADVEIYVDGNPKLCKACATEIAPGMIVNTNTDRVIESRKTNLELLLSNHTGDCRPPCVLACPAHTDCQGYVGLIANGEFEAAL